MVITENIIINAKTFIKHYSDNGYYLIQNETGNKYGEAIDLPTSTFTYIESDELIEKPD